MNIFVYEVKSNLKSMLIFSISIVTLFLLLMLGVYPLYMDSKADIMKVLENFPPAFAKAFGMSLENLFSYGGFYSFAFGYLALIGGIMAVALSLAIFAHEKRAKCVDFLLTKPMSRGTIFIRKLFAALSILLVSDGIYILCSIVLYQKEVDSSISFARFLLADLGLFFTQLIFLAFGAFYAIFAKKVRQIAGTATAFGFAAFILSSLSNVLEEEVMELVAPLKYFDPTPIFRGEVYPMKFVITSVVLMLACFTASYVRFCKQDMHAV
ncbi:MAG: beta-exotoxin transport system permease protein [Clostridiales bacterium]|nr:beta-exotoxin transport system permease protein [Clostridiales bacterium]